MRPQLMKISPSKLGMWSRCQYQWYRRYVMGEKVPPSVAVAFGSAFDGAVRKGAEDGLGRGFPSVDVFQDAFVEVWGLEQALIEDWEGEVPHKLQDKGCALLEGWRPLVEGATPLAAQKVFECTVNDAPIEGIIDLVVGRESTSSTAVIEVKTAGRPWRSVEARVHGKVPARVHQSLQGVAYQIGLEALYEGETGGVEFHVASRSNTTVDKIPYKYSLAAQAGYATMVNQAIVQIESAWREDTWLPTAHMCGHHWCSKRMCGYWRACVDAFGGERPG